MFSLILLFVVEVWYSIIERSRALEPDLGLNASFVALGKSLNLCGLCLICIGAHSEN